MEYKPILSALSAAIGELQTAQSIARRDFINHCRSNEALSDDDICWKMAKEDFPESEYFAVSVRLFEDKHLIERDRIAREIKEKVCGKNRFGEQL